MGIEGTDYFPIPFKVPASSLLVSDGEENKKIVMDCFSLSQERWFRSDGAAFASKLAGFPHRFRPTHRWAKTAHDENCFA